MRSRRQRTPSLPEGVGSPRLGGVLDRLEAAPVAGVVIEAAREFGRDRASRTAAALAYYALFSLAPLLLLAVGTAGLVFGDVTEDLASQLETFLPPETVTFIVGLVEEADASAGIAFGFSVVLSLWSGSAIFSHLQVALNDMFDVSGEAPGGIVGFLRRRVLGALGVIGVGLLLVLLLAGNAAVRTLVSLVPGAPEWLVSLVPVASGLVSFSLLWGVFALVFRYLTAYHMPWTAVRRGAAFTAAALLVAAVAVGWFIGRFGVGGAVGAASSVAVLLYVSFLLGQVVLFGAELTAAYASRLASRAAADRT